MALSYGANHMQKQTHQRLSGSLFPLLSRTPPQKVCGDLNSVIVLSLQIGNCCWPETDVQQVQPSGLKPPGMRSNLLGIGCFDLIPS